MLIRICAHNKLMLQLSGIINRKKIFYGVITFIFFPLASSFAQVEAIFDAVPTGGCSPLTVEFQNSSTGSYLYYYWDFGLGFADTSNAVNPVKTFSVRGVYSVTLTVTNTVTMETDAVTHDIEVDETPEVDFSVNKPSFCRSEPVRFEFTPSDARLDSLRWDFGDGTQISTLENPVFHTYTEGDTYDVILYAFLGQCADTITHTVTVKSVLANFTMSTYEGCLGDSVVFALGDTADITSFKWLPEGIGGLEVSNINPYSHPYNVASSYLPLLQVSGPDGSCELTDSTLRIYYVDAGIGYQSNVFCDGLNVTFKNLTSSDDTALTYLWDLGNGQFDTSYVPTESYSAGEYTVKLLVNNSIGCADSASEEFTINPLPGIVVGNDTSICQGGTAQLFASGGNTIVWSPVTGLNNFQSYTPLASPDTLTRYEPVVTDTITNCRSVQGSVAQTVTVLIPEAILTTINVVDTTIYLGASVTIQVDSSPNFNYLWSPDQYISCTSCTSPIIKPLVPGEYIYTLTVWDKIGCASIDTTVRVISEELYSIGLSEAFTPNGDGINETIMVDGWGISRLVEFSVYNRWGQKMFTTDNLEDLGWDGTFEGKPQKVDTYTYLIKAEMLNDTVIEKRGSFGLFR